MRELRIFLVAGALGWGICLIGLFLPWNTVVEFASGLGAGTVTYDPMLDYWFRMMCGGFSAIGCMFAVAAYNPKKYWNMITLLGCLSITESIVIAIHGFRLGLSAFPFYADVSFCLVVGTAIILLQRKINFKDNHAAID